MKFIHLSDLHIGKRVNGFSMLEDQKYILERIIEIIDKTEAKAVVIAGDVYDKNVPSGEAVLVFDEFLTRLSQRGLYALIISGNHDSPERLSFASRLISEKRIYIAPPFDGKIMSVSLEDDKGRVNFYMLPYIRPSGVRKYFERELESYEQAVSCVLETADINPYERNILIAHQFVTGAETSDSEEFLGGVEAIGRGIFKDFDYVALGHIHKPQYMGKNIRYCGTPLKYSFSEINRDKTVTEVEIGKKGEITVKEHPLTPLRNMREIKGSYNDIINAALRGKDDRKDDYVHVILTDENYVPDAIGGLREIYPNIMALEYSNLNEEAGEISNLTENPAEKSPIDIFSEFYEKQNGKAPEERQIKYVEKIIYEIMEDIE